MCIYMYMCILYFYICVQYLIVDQTQIYFYSSKFSRSVIYIYFLFFIKNVPLTFYYMYLSVCMYACMYATGVQVPTEAEKGV